MFQRLSQWNYSGHSHFPSLQKLEILIDNEFCIDERVIIPTVRDGLKIKLIGNVKKPCKCKNLSLFDTWQIGNTAP